MADAAQSAGMTLGEHLNELRSRIVKSTFAILVATLLIWNRYEQVFVSLRRPFDEAHKQHPESILALTGVTSGLSMQLNVALVGGAILASPVWIFQIWRFITPGLHPREKRWTFGFTVIALPMFLAGCALGYFALPHTLDALFSFTPTDVTNVTNVENYISFSLHLTLFFGLGFLIPVIMLGANVFGLVSGRTLLQGWRWIVVGAFFFGAIATPNGDPLGMTIIAVPIVTLCFSVVGVALIIDKRRSSRAADV